MAGPSVANGRWSVAVSLLVAVAMAAIATVTVNHAGCADPGRYVVRDGGYELIGGCVEPGDLPVDSEITPAAPQPDRTVPVRP